MEAQATWSREREAVESAFDELRQGCAIRWVLGQEDLAVEEESRAESRAERTAERTADGSSRAVEAAQDDAVQRMARELWARRRHVPTEDS